MNPTYKKSFILLFELFFSIALLAQEKVIAPQFWIAGGLGHSTSEAFTQNEGLVGGIGFNVSNKQQLVSVQLNHFWETNMEDKMQGEFNEWKIQYGWINTKKRHPFFISGGLAYTECNHFKEVFRGEGLSVQREISTMNAWGVVAETGINFIINKHLGVGISSFTNLNKNAFSAGYRINVLLGLFE